MGQKIKIRKTFNVECDTAEKFKMVVPDNEQSKRINQFMLDEIELHSDMILESDSIMKLKKKVGNLNLKLKETKKILKDVKIDIPIIEEDIAHVLSQIEKQRDIENKSKKEVDE